MQQIVKEDILSAITKAYEAFSRFDIARLNQISNFTIHNAGIFQDENSITFAITVYALAKVSEREREKDYPEWKKFKEKVLELLKEARKDLERGDDKSYNMSIRQILKIIGGLDKRLTKYATEAIEHARIKKGSKMYEHGVSAGRVAELMGISEWELQSYVGEAGLSDRIIPTKSAKERLSKAKKIFGAK